MKKLPETVTHQFAQLFAALRTATDDLKLAGAEANLLGDFSRVEALNDSCRKLQALESDIRFTVDNFGSHFKARTDANNRPHKGHRHHTRKAGARLRVKVGEQVIAEATIAKTPVNGYPSQKRCDCW